MSRTRILLLLLFAVQAFFVKSQSNSYDLWHIGTLYLTTGDSLKGLLKYGSEKEMVQMKAGGKEFAFNYAQIDSFWIIDITDSTRRDFNIYSYTNLEGFDVPLPFEDLVSNPKFQILVREIVRYENAATFVNQGFMPTRDVEYQYYYMQGGQLLFFNNSKRDVMEIVGDKGNEIMEYMKGNKLHFSKKKDLKLIFEYYYKLLSS